MCTLNLNIYMRIQRLQVILFDVTDGSVFVFTAWQGMNVATMLVVYYILSTVYLSMSHQEHLISQMGQPSTDWLCIECILGDRSKELLCWLCGF